LATEDRINEFDPDNVETISGWILEYPFIEWVPSSREYPVLPIRRPDGAVGMYSVRGVLGRGGFGIVFLCVESEQQFAIKMPRIGPWDGTTVTDIGLRLDRELPLDPVAVDQTFARRVNEQRQALADGLAATNLDQVLQTFRSETSMLTRLRHPNIVPLEFSGEIIAGTSADGNHAWECRRERIHSFTTVKRHRKAIDEAVQRFLRMTGQIPVADDLESSVRMQAQKQIAEFYKRLPSLLPALDYPNSSSIIDVNAVGAKDWGERLRVSAETIDMLSNALSPLKAKLDGILDEKSRICREIERSMQKMVSTL